MKKITLLFIGLLASFASLQAQNFDFIYTLGGPDNNQNSTKVVTDWLHYDNGSNYTSFGTSTSHDLGVYIQLTTSMLAPHINRQIEEVKFYLGPDLANITGDIAVEIYTDLSAAPVYTENFATSGLTADSWNTVSLSTPFVIDGTEIFVGYKYTAAGYIIGVDDGSNYATGVQFYTFDGAVDSWDNVAPYNFNLQAGIGGATSANDAGVSEVIMDNIISAGTMDITATIVNYGSNTLNSIDFNYTVDGGTVNTDNLTGLNLAQGQTLTVTHSVPWDATPGAHSLDVYTSNFNGNGDDDIPANDHYVMDVMVLNEIFDRNVVYEEGTGTWCGWCVRGIVGLKDMYHYHGDGSFIGIAVHNGDPMVVTEYDDNLGIGSFPSGKMDRKSTTVDPGYSELEAAYYNEKAIAPLAKVQISNLTWDSSSRELNIDVTARFALDIPNADYNMAVIVVEDGVTGTSGGYAQGNYYSGQYHLVDWEGTDYFNLPNPIPASQMVYNHVGRDLIGGFDGVDGSIPSSVTYNTPYTYTFNYTLPSNFNEDNVHFVAIIIDNNTGEIVNGYETGVGVNAVNDFLAQFEVQVYPNPASDIVTITGAEELNIAIYDVLGNLILSKDHNSDFEQISLDNFANGMYFIQFTKGNESGTLKFIVNK